MVTPSEYHEKKAAKILRTKLLDFEIVFKRINRVLDKILWTKFTPEELFSSMGKLFKEFTKARILERELIDDSSALRLFDRLDTKLRQDLSQFVTLHDERWQSIMEGYCGVRNPERSNLTLAKNSLEQEYKYIEKLNQRINGLIKGL